MIRYYLRDGEDRCNLLLKSNARRAPQSLSDAITFLWSMVGAPERVLRSKATSAFMALVGLLRGADPTSPARAWVLKLGLSEVLTTVEGPAAEVLSPGLRPAQAKNPVFVGEALDKLTASLDAYLWLFGKAGVLRARPFLEGTEAFVAPSKAAGKRGRDEGEGEGDAGEEHRPVRYKTAILTCIRVVVESVWATDVGPGGYEKVMGLAPMEAGALRGKSAVALAMAMDLLSLFLEQGLVGEVVKAGLWSRPMQRVLSWCLLRPWGTGTLSRPEEDEAVALRVPAAARRLLTNWKALDEAVGSGGPTFLSTLKEVRSSFHALGLT